MSSIGLHCNRQPSSPLRHTCQCHASRPTESYCGGVLFVEDDDFHITSLSQFPIPTSSCISLQPDFDPDQLNRHPGLSCKKVCCTILSGRSAMAVRIMRSALLPIDEHRPTILSRRRTHSSAAANDLVHCLNDPTGALVPVAICNNSGGRASSCIEHRICARREKLI